MQKGQTWNVLDKGYVKYINSMGSDEEIVEAARMSTGKGFIDWNPVVACEICGVTEQEHMVLQNNCDRRGAGLPHVMKKTKGDNWFLEFLYSHKHMTPFEMPELTIEFKAPIVVIWEWVRHRTQTYNIESGRYIQLANEHYLPTLDRFARQSTVNKQDSSLELFDPIEAQAFVDLMYADQEQNYALYNKLVDEGVAKELARLNAPMSRYSRGRAKANLRNWFAFLLLRKRTAHSKPQWEISQYADIVGEIIKTLWPRSYALFEEYTLYSVTFSRTEMAALQAMAKDYERMCRTFGTLISEAGLPDTRRKAFLEKLNLEVF